MAAAGQHKHTRAGSPLPVLLVESRVDNVHDGNSGPRTEELRLRQDGVGWEVNNEDKNPNQRNATVSGVFARVFLPVGYPHSVRKEYLEYQAWDSLQGLSSYLRSVLCARSVLTGAGVGNGAVTPLAVALAWTSRDGVAILGSLVFAYQFSGVFECNLKEWRLLADVFNNIALTLDLVTGLLPTRYFLLVSGLSSLFKALCGLVAGATKARISQHFSRDGSLADVIAKESTQETAVTLLGLVLGMALSQLVGTSDNSTFALFLILLVLHQWANYRLVKVLVLDTLSAQRLLLITQALVVCPGDPPPSPQQVCASERLWRPLHLCFRGPRVGVSARHICLSGGISWAQLQACCGDVVRVCLFGLDRHGGRVVVCLREGASELDCLRAHLVAYFLSDALERHGSARTLAERYRALVETVAPALRAWASLHVLIDDDALRDKLTSVGWDLGTGKARLGEGGYRIALPPPLKNKKDL